ncbi:MAG TPA: trypsin-like serine protease [Xanthobacteraceae bacterium]|nr:trypsin-like serine protease [Xanthobacteraceae bacterium]
MRKRAETVPTGTRAAAFLCATLAAASVVTRAAAMVGGAPPAGQGAGRSVVMILGSYGTACTATAIARDLLLTAAHCVQPGADYKLADTWSSPTPTLKDITRIERDPQFEIKRLFAHLATADVALAKLAQPLPGRFPPVPLDDATQPISAGDTFVVAGYGVTVRGDGRTGGTVRAATLIATGTPNSLQLRLVDPHTNDERPGLGACAGDSGAPTFRETGGNYTIVGVVSWSTGPKLSGGCGGLTGVTPLASHRAWIVETARALGSPLAP